jgi:hypothetical protein
MEMKLRFLGAVQNVTGSRHLLEANGTLLLVDCGLYQERQFLARNWEPFAVPHSPIMEPTTYRGTVSETVVIRLATNPYCAAIASPTRSTATQTLVVIDAANTVMRHRAQASIAVLRAAFISPA